MDIRELYLPHTGWLAHETGDHVAKFLAEGWFEYREQAFLWLYLRSGSSFVDCGAHVGLFSVIAGRALGDTGTVISIEPHPQSAMLLKQNLRTNGVLGGRVRQTAVLARAGSGRLYVGAPGKAAYSSLAGTDVSQTSIAVEADTLDSILVAENLFSTVDLVKIDVEGAELEVLAGAAVTIRNGRFPLILIECTEENLQRFGKDTKALFQALQQSGYRICRLDGGTCQLVEYPYSGAIAYDNLFAAQDLDQVNSRLRAAPESVRRVANDILSRGAACEKLYRQAMQTEIAANNAALSATAANDAFRITGEANWGAEQAEKRAMEAERRAAEARAESLESERRAEESRRRAEEGALSAQDSYRRVGEANWRAEQAEKRAIEAERRAAEARAESLESERRAEDARQISEKVTRLAEMNLLQRAGRGHPEMPENNAATLWEQRIQTAAIASEFRRRLEELLASRSFRWGQKLGLDSKPAWADDLDLVVPMAAELKSESPVVAESDPAESDPAESEMMRALRHLDEKGFRPRVVLDVGAGKGYWSILSGGYFRSAEFYLLEPLVENEPDLRGLCERDAQHKYILTAAGNQSGNRTIQVSPELDSSTMMIFPGADTALQRSIAVTTVDELLAEKRIRMPDLVKIDVQGMELQVLEGSQKLFAHTDVFIIEVNLFVFLPGCPRIDEVIGYMAERGYYLFDLAGSLRRPFEDDLGQLDLVMVSERSPLVASKRWQ